MAGLFQALMGGAAPPAAAAAAADQAAPPQEKYSTEFHKLYEQFATKDAARFQKKYPLTGLVATVALAFFGLMNVLSFSPTNILTGAFMLTLSVCLAKGAWKRGVLICLNDIQQAIVQLVQYRGTVNGGQKKEAAPEAAAPAENNNNKR